MNERNEHAGRLDAVHAAQTTCTASMLRIDRQSTSRNWNLQGEKAEMIGIYLSGIGNIKHCVERLVSLPDATAKCIPLEASHITDMLKKPNAIILGYPTQFSNAPFIFIWLLILLICFGGIAFFANAAMFRPYQKIKPPADGRRVTFPSGRNRLVGYLWNETGTRGLLVFAHGMGAGMEYYLPEIHHFAAQGYKVFAFEYSGYPGSSGHFYGFPQAVIDLKNALDFIDDGALPVILMGHSMGAYAVCAVRQCTDKPVDGIVAYAPFFSSDEAVIAEATGSMPKCGKLVCSLILPIQRVLFGRNCNLTAVAGLSRANVPTLVLQGSKDVEVPPDGCALYAHRRELADSPVTFRLIGEEGSDGHMTVIRKRGSQTINEGTMCHVDTFLDAARRR